MNDDMKISGWALNSEYFCSILHELRDDASYRAIVDSLVVVPEASILVIRRLKKDCDCS